MLAEMRAFSLPKYFLRNNLCGQGKRLSRWCHKPEGLGSTPGAATNNQHLINSILWSKSTLNQHEKIKD